MSSTANTNGPPGPPPGPPGPPPPPGAAKAQDVSRYQAYLKQQGIQAAASDLHEEERMRVGTWRFYYRGARPGMKDDVVALDDAGTAVTVADKNSWHALLATSGMDAKGAHQRLTWLMGKAAPIDGTYKLRDEGAAAKVGAPALEQAGDGTITFTGWVLYPPNMQTPYQMRVTAPKSGPATLTNTVWNKL